MISETFDYKEPVSILIGYGDPSDVEDWDEYMEFNFTEKDIPELIRMVKDERFDVENVYDFEVWAPNHALRVLGLLKAVSSVKDLLYSLKYYYQLSDDIFLEDLPEVIKMIGPDSLPAIEEYLFSEQYNDLKELCTLGCLELLSKTYPETRSESIRIVSKLLQNYREHEEDFNGFLISTLSDLKAVESLPLIKEVFNEDCVDWLICGDLEDIEILLGVREERETPSPIEALENSLDFDDIFEFEDEDEDEDEPETYIREEPKIGRNDPCHCGSGKKFKKCCRK